MDYGNRKDSRQPAAAPWSSTRRILADDAWRRGVHPQRRLDQRATHYQLAKRYSGYTGTTLKLTFDAYATLILCTEESHRSGGWYPGRDTSPSGIKGSR